MPSWTSVTLVIAVGTWWRRRSARPGAQTRSVTSATTPSSSSSSGPAQVAMACSQDGEDAFERGVRERRLDVLPELRHGQEAHDPGAVRP